MLASNSQDLTLRLQETMRHILQGYAVPPVENTLLAVMDYALARSGKMLRGRLLLDAYRAVAVSEEPALFAAAAIEYLHLGTLIHDDMIDQDQLRRGSPAVWKQFGPDLALLSGDFLYFAAYQFLACNLLECKGAVAAHVLKLFSTACMDLCLGQALEEKLVGAPGEPGDETLFPLYLEIVRLKTAGLFRSAAQIGISLGGGSAEQVEALGRYAEYLGIAFQIVDDLQPFTNSEAELGKPVTSDIKNRRLTAPILYAFAHSGTSDQQFLSAIYGCEQPYELLPTIHRQILPILERTAALRNIRALAASYRQQAIAELLCLPDNAARNSLRMIANQLV